MITVNEYNWKLDDENTPLQPQQSAVRYMCISHAHTIKHVLLDCVDVADIRQKYFSVQCLKDLFTTIAGETILQFLKEINLYNKI